MSARSRAIRERRTRISRIAKQMIRDHGHARPADIAWVAINAGLKTSPAEVRNIIGRLGIAR